MTVRSDIVVDFTVSPRIVTVLSPSTEITIQDLHDTLREIEDDIWNLKEPRLVDSAGKEALGGGVLVGITSELQDAQLAFEARTTELESGTVTTADILGLTLTDSAALFVTNGVARGDLIYNCADGSAASVVTVLSETSVLTTGLIGGTDNQFDLGDDYVVYDVVQCNVSGGNLVAVDDVGADISPIFPTFGTQVVRASSSSATLQELEAIQFSSFNGGVSIDITSPYSGTEFPVGTPEQPVNNLSDALSISSSRGLDNIFVLSSMTLASLNFDNKRFVGSSERQVVITIDASASVVNAEFSRVTVTGTLDGNATLLDCTVQVLTFVNGLIKRCGLEGTITLGGSQPAVLINCYDALAGFGTPTIDMGGSGQDLIVRNYNGGLVISNKTGSDEVSVDVDSGRVVLDSTVTAGSIIVRGVGTLTDNSGGTASVTDDVVKASDVRLIKQMMAGNASISGSNPSVVTIFDEDGTTVLATFDVSADGLTRTRTS